MTPPAEATAYVPLGRSGTRVSKLALGTMNFGPLTDEPTAHAILDAALAAGINLIDTADVYGGNADRCVYGHDPRKGLTESIIGRWLAADPVRREQVVLTTKVFGQMGPGPNDIGLSARRIREACDASLRRLQTDYLDVYLLHHVDRDTPWDEIWDALGQLRDQGKVLAFGTSNHAAWQIVQGHEVGRRAGQLGFVVEQSIYSLLTRTIELEVLPACHALGIGVIPYSPLHGGLLGGILRKQDSGRTASPDGLAAEALARHRPQIERFETFCDELGEQPANVALAWLLHQRGVTAPIVGARTPGQLADAVRARELALEADALSELDAIFPGPGGPAPEAYAW